MRIFENIERIFHQQLFIIMSHINPSLTLLYLQTKIIFDEIFNSILLFQHLTDPLGNNMQIHDWIYRGCNLQHELRSYNKVGHENFRIFLANQRYQISNFCYEVLEDLNHKILLTERVE